jgi:hypothetical protein
VNKYWVAVIGVGCAVAIPTPAHSLGRILSILGGNGSASTQAAPTRPPVNVSAQTEEQSRQMGVAIASGLPNSLRERVTDAAPLIFDVLRVASCARADAGWNALSRKFMTPLDIFPWRNAYTAMPAMRYHEAASCLEVARVYDWSGPSTNTVRFTANLVSGVSGEAQAQTFTLQKMQSGDWLIQSVGYPHT